MKHSQKYWEVQMLIPLPWKVRLAHFLRLSLFSHLSHSLYLIQATSISFSISILALLCYQNLYCHIIALKHISRTNSRLTEIWRHFREMAINTLMDSRLWQNLLGVTRFQVIFPCNGIAEGGFCSDAQQEVLKMFLFIRLNVEC